MTSTDNRMRPFWLSLFVLISCSQSAVAEEPGPDLKWGINFSVSRVDVSKVDQCGQSRASTIRGFTFLPKYHDPQLRESVRAKLIAMHKSGFREIRTIIFFGPGLSISSDWFSINRDIAPAGNALSKYVVDVGESGFERLVVGWSPQGKASPICRVQNWGDCFDRSTLALSANFIRAVRRALGNPTKLPIRFELGVEQCAPPFLPEPVRSNLEAYTSYIVRDYIGEFPDDETTISCSIQRFNEGVASIDAAYAGIGRRPNYYQIHSYHRPGVDTRGAAQAIARKLQNKNIPLLIGEASYGDPEHVKNLLDGFSRLKDRLLGVYFWPLRNAMRTCHMDVPPPYTLDSAMGR